MKLNKEALKNITIQAFRAMQADDKRNAGHAPEVFKDKVWERKIINFTAINGSAPVGVLALDDGSDYRLMIAKGSDAYAQVVN